LIEKPIRCGLIVHGSALLDKMIEEPQPEARLFKEYFAMQLKGSFQIAAQSLGTLVLY